MKILVFAHRLEVGGTQVNAVELTATLRDRHGHDVTLFATPGPMNQLAKESDLRFLPAPDAHRHPSLARMRELHKVIQRERPDLVHVWDWPQCLDAYFGAHLWQRVPTVVTDMAMSISRVLPRALPTTFGTPELVDLAKAQGRHPVDLIVPPVDVCRNAPDVVDPEPFRKQFGLMKGDVVLVTVSRLTTWMKAESLRRTIDAVRALGRRFPLRFVIVGDGPARGELEQLANQTNAEVGRHAVVFAGAMVDPRPAYAAADIVVGMGGSGLRAMAFGKPLVVVGEHNFSAPFNPQTADSFYYRGIYGIGDRSQSNSRLIGDISGLVEDMDNLPELGRFSRQFVTTYFSLETVAARLDKFCRAAVSNGSPFRVSAADGLRTAALLVARRVIPESLRR